MNLAVRWAHGADILVNGAGLVGDDSLYSEIIVRLFTDRRALPDDVIPDGSNDRRGVWSDSFNEGEPMGSRLWLLDREKLLPQTAIRAREYIEESLATLISDGRVLSIDVTTELHPPRSMLARIKITLLDGSIYEPFPNKLQIDLQNEVGNGY